MKTIRLFLPVFLTAFTLVALFYFVNQSAYAQEGATDGVPMPHREPMVETGLEAVSEAPLEAPMGINTVSTGILGSGDSWVHGLVYYNNYLWACTRTIPARILKIDPVSLAVVTPIPLPSGQNECEDIHYGNGYLWAILYNGGAGNAARLIRIDPNTATAQTAKLFSTSELRFGATVEYAFGYLWIGGQNHLIQMDISQPLNPTYQVHDYSSLILYDSILFGALTNNGSNIWTMAFQYDDVLGYIDDAIIKLDPNNPTSTYITQSVNTFFPDDMVHQGSHVYMSSEEDPVQSAPSDLYRFPTMLAPYTATQVANSASYGTFINPMDCESVWGAYVGAPGKVLKFDLNANKMVTLTLPTNFNDPSEITFDSNGNMYIATWQDPARMVKYSAPISPAVIITKTSGDVVLSWTHNQSDVNGYQVWRSTQPYFDTCDAAAVKVSEVSPPGIGTSTYFTDTTSGIADVNVNYFYTVRAVNNYGLVSPVSNRVGDFDFSITPAGPTNDGFNVIALPLDVSDQITDAIGLSNYVGASVQQALHWDAASQTFEAWYPPIGFGVNFSLQTGQVYWLQVDSSATSLLNFVGEVPAQGAVQFSLLGSSVCLLNEFSIPLDQATVTSASGLSTLLGDVEQTLHWDAASQTYEAWYPDFGFGIDFGVKTGNPYHACLRTGTTWP